MKPSTTAKMTGFSPGYVSKVASGIRHNDKIKQLLEVPEQDFIAYFFLNPAMLNICDAAIRNCRKTADKKLAVELSTAVNHFQQIVSNGKSKKVPSKKRGVPRAGRGV